VPLIDPLSISEAHVGLFNDVPVEPRFVLRFSNTDILNCIDAFPPKVIVAVLLSIKDPLNTILPFTSIVLELVYTKP